MTANNKHEFQLEKYHYYNG